MRYEICSVCLVWREIQEKEEEYGHSSRIHTYNKNLDTDHRSFTLLLFPITNNKLYLIIIISRFKHRNEKKSQRNQECSLTAH